MFVYNPPGVALIDNQTDQNKGMGILIGILDSSAAIVKIVNAPRGTGDMLVVFREYVPGVRMIEVTDDEQDILVSCLKSINNRVYIICPKPPW